MGKKIVVNKIKQKIITCVFNDFDLKRISVSDEDKESILDNIYVAKVKNIVKNINAAFVEIENGQMCYLELKNINNPIILNEKKNNDLVAGDELVVQVVKEAMQNKEPVVTTAINIKGEGLILTHSKLGIGISNKIKQDDLRDEYRNCLKKYASSDYGFIVRTSAMSMTLQELEEEAKTLITKYRTLLDKAKYAMCFKCIERALPGYINDIKDMFASDIEEIVIEDDKLFVETDNYIGDVIRRRKINFRHYEDSMISLSKLYSIESHIASLLKDRVWLKSGSNIVIQRTEALTAIDVNTSKAIKGKSSRQTTFLKTNLEAAREIAKQISLRNIGGIIIVDFIDMDSEEDKQILLRSFQEYLDKDYVKANIIDMTKLNLVEITRKKVKQPLENQLYGL